MAHDVVSLLGFLPVRQVSGVPFPLLLSHRASKIRKGSKRLMKYLFFDIECADGGKATICSFGYVIADMDFKIITISRVDITYPGSVIDAVIRADGYIESVTYTINMSTYAELSGMGISGYGTLEGAQTEQWNLIW